MTTIIIGFTEAGKCVLCQGRQRVGVHLVHLPQLTAIVPCPVCVGLGYSDLAAFVESAPVASAVPDGVA